MKKIALFIFISLTTLISCKTQNSSEKTTEPANKTTFQELPSEDLGTFARRNFYMIKAEKLKGHWNGFAKLGNKLIFLGRKTRQDKYFLWETDGTASGTHPLRPVPANAEYVSPNFTEFKGKTYFFPDGHTLWMTDGSAAGTQIAHSFPEIPHYEREKYFLIASKERIFVISTKELWVSEGSVFNLLKKNFKSENTRNSMLNSPVGLLGNKILLFLEVYNRSSSLLVTDGTTEFLKEEPVEIPGEHHIRCTNAFSPEINGKIYFFCGGALNQGKLKLLYLEENSEEPKLLADFQEYNPYDGEFLTMDKQALYFTLRFNKGSEYGIFKILTRTNSVERIGGATVPYNLLDWLVNIGDNFYTICRTSEDFHGPNELCVINKNATNAPIRIEQNLIRKLHSLEEKNGKLFIIGEPISGGHGLWISNGQPNDAQRIN